MSMLQNKFDLIKSIQIPSSHLYYWQRLCNYLNGIQSFYRTNNFHRDDDDNRQFDSLRNALYKQ